MIRHFVIKLKHASYNQYGRKIEYGRPECYLWDVDQEINEIRPDIFGCYGWACCPVTSDFASTWEQLKKQQLDEMWQSLNRVISHTEVLDQSYEVTMLRKMIKQLEALPCPKYPTRLKVAKKRARHEEDRKT